jgi:PAS domain S-box-containing protein
MNDESISPKIQDPERLAALRDTGLLDSMAEEAFDRITRLASRVLGAPVTLVSLVDGNRQFFKSQVGLGEPWASRRETPLSHSFCQHVVATTKPLVVEDASTNPDLAHNLAIRDLNVVAYIGVPIRDSNGQVLGSFCAIDSAPRQWTEDDVQVLSDLAQSVMVEIARREALATAEAVQQRLEGLTDALPAQIAYVDREQRYRFVNAAYPRRFARPRDAIVGTSVRDLVGDKAFREVEPHVVGALEGQPQHYELTFDSPIGRTTNEVFYVPDHGSDGRVHGFYSLVLDITAHRAAENALVLSEERYRTLFNSIDEGFCVVEVIFDDDGKALDYRFLDVNPAFEKHTGLADVVGKTILELIPNIERHWIDIYAGVALTGEPNRFIESSGAMGRHFDIYAFRTGPAGSRQVAILFTDITDRRQSEDTQQLLIDELNHRVRNTLTVVKSIAAQTRRHSASLDDFGTAFDGRMQALSETHTLLAQNRWRASSLQALAEQQLRSHVSRPEVYRVAGPDAFFGAKAMLSLSLIFHELTTNATKYGSLTADEGTVEVIWEIVEGADGKEIALVWRERGGPPITPPTRKGFGTNLIDFNIAHEFEGRIEREFGADGLVCRITIPLARAK